MSDILKIIKERHSDRVPFNPNRSVSKENLKQILEAGRWAPTAHNMQNFDIVTVDEKEVLEKIGSIKSSISEAFLRENYEQLSFNRGAAEKEDRNLRCNVSTVMDGPVEND